MVVSAESTLVVGSIGAATNRGLLRASREAAEVPCVEIRLDLLEEPADFAALREAFRGKTLLATLRSRADGGRFEGDRAVAGPVLRAALEVGFDLVDLEFRTWNGDRPQIPAEKVVVSWHDGTGMPERLDALAEDLGRLPARYIKIVGTASNTRDALDVLEFQRRSGSRITAFAMGEPGRFTRVLSPYLGAPLAFGSVIPGGETAPGQVLARDLLEIFGIGRKRPVDRLFAVVGGLVAHSLSPVIHNANFEALGESALYVPVALRSLLEEFPPLVASLETLGLPLMGASVTLPFKAQAAELGRRQRVKNGPGGEGKNDVANTLMKSGSFFTSSNTDRLALEAFVPRAGSRRAALVLGAGGTARTAVEVLVSRGYEVFAWSRDPGRAGRLADEMGASALPSLDGAPPSLSVLVNCTPLGLKSEDPLPCPPNLVGPGTRVIDCPYRPGGTALIRLAREVGAPTVDGFAFLLEQAAGQAALFTGRPTTSRQLLDVLPDRFKSLFEVSA